MKSFAADGAKVLILGAMPGAASSKKGEYYAGAGDQFWRILGELFGQDIVKLPYERRLEILRERGIALWDVLAEPREDGEPNRIAQLLRETGIKTVLLNGGGARRAFKEFIAETLPAGVAVVALPSTSAAERRFTYAEKLDAWRAACETS